MTGFLDPTLRDLIPRLTYKDHYEFHLVHKVEDDGSGGWQLIVVSYTPNSIDKGEMIRVGHPLLVPPAVYKEEVWLAWVFDHVRAMETHEAGEFFKVDGVRVFAPHHANGEDPYRVWLVSDYATADKQQGDE